MTSVSKMVDKTWEVGSMLGAFWSNFLSRTELKSLPESLLYHHFQNASE